MSRDPRFNTGDPIMDAALAADDAKLEAMGAYDEEDVPEVSEEEYQRYKDQQRRIAESATFNFFAPDPAEPSHD